MLLNSCLALNHLKAVPLLLRVVYFLLVFLYLQLLVLLHYNAQKTPIQHLPNTSLPNLLPPNLLPPNLLPPNLLPPNLLPPNLLPPNLLPPNLLPPPQNVHEGHPPPFANQRFPN